MAMNCEEFAVTGLGAERESKFGSAQRAAAQEHLETCSRCAALAESWDAARVELQLLRDATSVAGAPPRVEMRLRQEFRTRHRGAKVRRTAVAAAWALATAAVLVGAVGWNNWRTEKINAASVAQRNRVAASDENLVADNDDAAFTPLPGAMYTGNGDTTIVHVGMERSALGALGLPVNEDRANEWIHVDLLVGDDGLPQAVRVAE
jgi:hypothetical protein